MSEINNGTFFKFNDFFPNDIHFKIHEDLENSLNWGMIQNSQGKEYPDKVPIPMEHKNKSNDYYSPRFWINILGGTIPMAENVEKHNYFFE